MSKVSVVVPIYNVEQYLEKCIDSIINQTHNDLEIILVDDGSTDSSPSICDKWKEKDNRVVVIHKQNGGLSDARNAGMEKATGKYIMFEDSDDWLDLDIIKKSVERIEKDNSDLVIFGYKKVDEKGKDLGIFTFGNETYTNEEMSSQLHKRILEMSFGYAWNKLYRLSILKKEGLRNDGSIIDREDLFFNLCLFKYVERISYLDSIGYNYLQRNDSLLHNADLKRLNNVNKFYDNIIREEWSIGVYEKKIKNMIFLHYLSDAFIKNIIWNNQLSKKEKIKKMNDIIKKYSGVTQLYKDTDNPRYLNVLFNSIKRTNAKQFYYYVRISDFKRTYVK